MNELLEKLADLLGLDSVEFLASLKEGDKLLEGKPLTDKVGEMVQQQIKSAKDAQHKRGLRESAEANLRWMKGQGFTNPDGLKGQELLDAYAEWAKAQGGEGDEGKKKPAEMSEQELASLPGVKALLTKRLQAAEARYSELENKFQEETAKARRQSVQSIGYRRMAEILEAKGAILEVAGAGVTKDARLAAFAKLLPWEKMRTNDKGDDIILTGEDGEQLVDDYGKPVTFESLVLGEAKPLFGFQKVDPKKGSPSPGQRPGPGATDKPKMTFADAAEYQTYLTNEPDAEKRLEAQQAWLDQSAEGE